MRTNCSTQKPGRITTSDPHPHSPGRRDLRRLLRRQFRPHWRWFAAGTVCAFFTALAGISYGGLVKLLGDQLQAAAGGGLQISGAGWLWLPGGIVIAAIVRAISLYLMTLANNTGVQRALIDVSNAQFAALTDGDHARVAGSASGGFVSRFINDLNTLRDFGLRVANNVPKGTVTILGALAAMLWMDWQLAVILLVAYPIAFGPVIALGKRVRARAKRSQEQVGEVTAFLSEGFQAARTVTAYSLQDYQKARADASFVERARLYLKVLTDKAAVDPILEITGGVAIAGVLAVSAWRISAGASTIGDFLGFVTLIGVAAPELRVMGGLNAVAQEARAASERFHDLVDAPQRVEDAQGAEHLEKVAGDVAFQDVSFAYEGGGAVLNGLSFKVSAGETVALVGASGAGKSTVFNLLLRLYDPANGVVCLDGRDIRQVPVVDLRAGLALVEQEPALFDDTVAANIALGRLGASRADIERAAQAAHADGFVRELEDGYGAAVGERGNRFSGGQRQRIALARAFLRDAPILLLDEATSALDASSEAAVQAALQEFASDRTVMVIAHRLATVQWADRILVLENGRIVEEGTHAELLAAGGSYARFAAEQLR